MSYRTTRSYRTCDTRAPQITRESLRPSTPLKLPGADDSSDNRGSGIRKLPPVKPVVEMSSFEALK